MSSREMIARLDARLLRMAAIIIVCTIVVASASTVYACPTCKDGLAENPQGQSLAAGFYYSILLMMGMPFLILGTFITFAYRSVQRAKAQHEQQPVGRAEAGRLGGLAGAPGA